MRKIQEGAMEANLHGFLTTETDVYVDHVHPYAMRGILTVPEE